MLPQPAAGRPSPDTLGLAAIALAAALWALGAAVAKGLFEAGLDPLGLAGARSLMTAAGLALVPGAWRPGRSRLPVAALVALGLAIALVNAAYYLAIDHVAVAVAVVLQYTAPVLVVAYTAAASRRAPGRDIVLALVAAVAGVVLVSGITEGWGSIDGFGVAMGLAAALLFATYTLLSERVGGVFGPLGAMARAFSIAALFWVLYLSLAGWPGALFEPSNLPGVLYVGVFATLVPFMLYVWGVQHVRAARGAIAATLEPVLAAVVAWTWLGQSLSLIQVAGGLLVVAAVLVLHTRRPAAILVPEV